MKHMISILVLVIAQNTLAADVTGANQLIAGALGLQSNEVTLKGFVGATAPKPIMGKVSERECQLNVILDANRAYLQLWSAERSVYSDITHLEYIHGEDAPDVYSQPKILESIDSKLKIETEVTRPPRVFYPDGAEQVQTLTIRNDLQTQVRSVEISLKLRGSEPNQASRILCRFPGK